jgi:hypothetical protein
MRAKKAAVGSMTVFELVVSPGCLDVQLHLLLDLLEGSHDFDAVHLEMLSPQEYRQVSLAGQSIKCLLRLRLAGCSCRVTRVPLG